MARVTSPIVPLAPGGASDVLARMVMQRLSTVLGVPIVVENKLAPGAYGGWRHHQLARDQRVVVSQAGYDPIKSFTPIALVGSNPLVLAVSKNTRFTSFGQALEAVRKAPASVSSASSGYGSSTHMIVELLA